MNWNWDTRMSEQLKAAKAADKILKKYGVLIDPDTLSPEALRRVARLKSFPRIQTWQNLSACWKFSPWKHASGTN